MHLNQQKEKERAASRARLQEQLDYAFSLAAASSTHPAGSRKDTLIKFVRCAAREVFYCSTVVAGLTVVVWLLNL